MVLQKILEQSFLSLNSLCQRRATSISETERDSTHAFREEMPVKGLNLPGLTWHLVSNTTLSSALFLTGEGLPSLAALMKLNPTHLEEGVYGSKSPQHSAHSAPKRRDALALHLSETHLSKGLILNTNSA